MHRQFTISVDDNFEFELGVDEAKKLDQTSYTDLHSKNAQLYHLLQNQKSFQAELLSSNFVSRQYRVKINDNVYNVAIGTSLDQLIKEMGLSLGNDSVEDEIHAPMPGIILEVNVAVGDEVKQGDFLCVLEAMKMENALSAPRNGVIKSVNIAKGETVEKGKLLIEFQEND